jgi:hypothetical protein
VEILQREIDVLKSSLTTGAASTNGHSGATSLNPAGASNSSLLNSSNHATAGLSPYVSNNVSSSSLQAGLKSPRGELNNGSMPPIEVLAEELEHKINENTSLHRSLNELELEFRQKVAKTEQLLKQSEYEKSLLERRVESLEQTSKLTVEKLQNDKIKLELNVIQLENQLREGGLITNNGFSAPVIDPVQSTPQLIIVDTKTGFNKQLETCVKTGVECLSKIYGSLGELRRFEKNSSKCEKCLDALRNHNSSNDSSLDETLNTFYKLNHTLVNEMLKSLETGSSHTVRNAEIDKLNKKLKIYLNKLKQLMFINEDESSNGHDDEQEQSIFNLSNILFTLFKFYFYQMEKSELGLFNDNQSRLEANLETLVDLLEKLLFVLNDKLPLEYSLNFSSKLTATDECLVSYLTQLRDTFGQFLLLVRSTNVVDLVEAARRPLVALSSAASLSSSTSSLVIHSPGKQRAEIEALRATVTKRECDMKEMREGLEKSVSELKFKLVTQEQRLKLQDDEISRLKSRPVTPQTINTQPILVEATLPDVSQLLPVVVNGKVPVIEVDCERMLDKLEYKMGAQTFEFYSAQVQLLSKKIQQLDSRAAFYHDEARSVREQLRAQASASTVKDYEISEVRDQLERTRKSYEMQMSTMSDHLIEVNDRMTRQLDENDKLKQELSAASGYGQGSAAAAAALNAKNSKSKKSK